MLNSIIFDPVKISDYVIENYQPGSTEFCTAFNLKGNVNIATVILKDEKGNFLKENNRYAHYEVYFRWDEACFIWDIDVIEILKVKLITSTDNSLRCFKNSAYEDEREGINHYLSVIEKTTL